MSAINLNFRSIDPVIFGCSALCMICANSLSLITVWQARFSIALCDIVFYCGLIGIGSYIRLNSGLLC